MKPILIVSDSPDCKSGLARIGRDIALRLHQAGAQVGYCGYWGKGYEQLGIGPTERRYLPYPFLAAGPDPTKNLLPMVLAADEFFEGEPGVVLFLYDPVWLTPFGIANSIPDEPWDTVAVKQWARGRRARGIELWGAFPVDAHCPSGKLPSITCKALEAWDRIGGWTAYGQEVLGYSLSSPELPTPALPAYLPLGMDPGWEKGDAERGGQILGVLNRPTLGVVATNQPRKDWGLVFQAFSMLPEEWVLWAHTNRRHDVWNMNQLVEEYGLGDRVRFTVQLSDEQLADCYAACAVTFAPGRGEGFGYPILESQLAGTPCVAIDYAGGAELTPNHVLASLLRPEGPYSFLRPVVDPGHVAHRLQGVMEKGQPETWLWDKVWPLWEAWFKEGGVL